MLRQKSVHGPALHLRWTDLGPSYSERGIFHGESANIVGNRVYFFGGYYCKEFGRELCLRPRRSTDISSDLSPRATHSAVLVDDKIYVYGGEDKKIEDLLYSDLIQYDIVTGEVSVVEARMTEVVGERAHPVAVFAPWRREIIMFGGIATYHVASREPRLNDTAAFHVDQKSWRPLKVKGQLPRRRTGHKAVLVGTQMYMYGGYTTSGDYLGDLWVLELRGYSAVTWSNMHPGGEIPTGRTVPCWHRLQHRFILYGGYSAKNNVTLQLGAYFPGTNKWVQDSPAGEIEVSGNAPRFTYNSISVQASDGILIFSGQRVFKLHVD